MHFLCNVGCMYSGMVPSFCAHIVFICFGVLPHRLLSCCVSCRQFNCLNARLFLCFLFLECAVCCNPPNDFAAASVSHCVSGLCCPSANPTMNLLLPFALASILPVGPDVRSQLVALLAAVCMSLCAQWEPFPKTRSQLHSDSGCFPPVFAH